MSAAANSLSDRNDARIRLAQSADVDALSALINIAFRVELPFIEGNRINPDGVRAYMKKGKFLLTEDSSGLAGCVYVEVRGDRGYLGLLGVEPQSQGTGLGRKLMDAAEEFFRTENCVAIDLRIVSARAPLPAFYRRFGYVETGTAPLPPDAPVKVPCHFILMSKMLG
jgi:ribosomal protein S18 acetylase RimI-like enzyme